MNKESNEIKAAGKDLTNTFKRFVGVIFVGVIEFWRQKCGPFIYDQVKKCITLIKATIGKSTENGSYVFLFRKYVYKCPGCNSEMPMSAKFCFACGFKNGSVSDGLEGDVKKLLFISNAIGFVVLLAFSFYLIYEIRGNSSQQERIAQRLEQEEKTRIEAQQKAAAEAEMMRVRIEKEKAEEEERLRIEKENLPDIKLSETKTIGGIVQAFNIQKNDTYVVRMNGNELFKGSMDSCNCYFHGVEHGPFSIKGEDILVIGTSSAAAGAPFQSYRFIKISKTGEFNAVKVHDISGRLIDEGEITCSGPGEFAFSAPIQTEDSLRLSCEGFVNNRKVVEKYILSEDVVRRIN